jgi:hypothetical protein
MSILQARTPNLMEVKLLDYRILINTSVTRDGLKEVPEKKGP